MRIHGEFVNKKNCTVGVSFMTSAGDGDIEIGGDGSGMYFSADDTVTTESGFNDSMDVIIPHSATVKLSVESYLPTLFAKGVRDVRVEISVDEACASLRDL